VATGRAHMLKAEAQEEHGLWKLAVRKHAGEEVYEKCIEWMQQEKKRRAAPKEPKQPDITGWPADAFDVLKNQLHPKP